MELARSDARCSLGACDLNGSDFPGGGGVATTAGNPGNRALNAPHEQCNSADSDHQHHERYGIVIEPVPNLCTHDDPHPVPTAFFWVRELSAASRLKV
jgi:hypothetical protein